MEEPPQQFSEFLRILVVDHETTIHNAIVEMSIGLNYAVTTCSMASFALTLLREAKSCFDVILIEEQMSDMDSYDFLKEITQQINIPAIMMGVDGSESTMMKAIANGACEYWIKPLNEDQINNMWQHVTRKVVNENEHDQILETLESNHNYQPPKKKNRLSWSQELNQEFLRAVNQFGLDNATPKKVLEVMNVPGLTKESVASHLEKKLKKKKKTMETLTRNLT
uniref:MYB family transcription factor n=1 Tax=Melilotus albus TaxID=47082 RepID=A0A896WCB4_MELAB|nr:MYB family transcription factor [Melilotus albus]